MNVESGEEEGKRGSSNSKRKQKTIESDYFSSFSFSSTTSSDHSKPELVSCAINQYRENIGNKKLGKGNKTKNSKSNCFHV